MQKLGKAFSDNVTKFAYKRKNIDLQKYMGWGARLTFLYFFLLLFSIILVGKLFHLTIVEGKDHERLADGNRIRTFIIHAPRGTIYDRRGVALTKNILGVRVEKKDIQDNFNGKVFYSQDVWKKLPKNKNNYETDYQREYSYAEITAPILGYISEISEEELNNPLYQYQDYKLGDYIGRQGLEAVLEKNLRGIDGKELIEVDASGNRMRTLGKVEAIAGQDVYLTIDINLQKKSYEAMGENKGAVVVSKPRSGEILSLVSTPSYNPNLFIQGMTNDEYTQLVTGEDQKLFNRAISGVYPPGSIFKLIVGTAALETGKFTADTIVADTGIIRIGDFSFSNWYFTQYGSTDGNVNFLKALARSNDIYFYKMGEAVGITEISKWAKIFGLGQKLGIELNGEAEGLVPDPVWRKKIGGGDWYLGDTYHISIGQGDLLTTPLQVNFWTNVIASRGYLCKPTLIKSSDFSPNCQNLQISTNTIDLLTEGMRHVCSKGDDVGYAGTAFSFFDFNVMQEKLSDGAGTGAKKYVDVACKTGTAETGDGDKTHAWFTVFAPLNKKQSDNYISGEPDIVATVLVEKGGEGSQVAAPIAKQILEEWFKR